ncbi:uncharacterized protein LOC143284319 [Babylonia areolata]|uniref:uncharacterized protein LOC143284319 n=1 Tax=Babylonia areolata TaxID=304850 RepID=UPI003FD62C15
MSKGKGKATSKEPHARSQFYLPVAEEYEDVDDEEASPPRPSTSKHSLHRSSAQSLSMDAASGVSPKPAISPKPKHSKSFDTAAASSSSSPSPGLGSSWCDVSGVTMRHGRTPGPGETTTGEVEMRRRHTFPEQMDGTDQQGMSGDSDEDMRESFSRASLEDYPEESEQILKKRKIMLKSLHSYFKKLVENMFPKPSEVKEVKQAKPSRRNGKFFHKTRGKKAASDPVKASPSQHEFLAHLAEEMGEEYKPEDIPDLLESLGGIRFSDLIKLEREEDGGQITLRHPELLRPSSVFLELKEEEKKKALAGPRVESIVDDSGKMTRRMLVPAQPHKLMLLKELFSNTASCKVMIEEKAGTVVFEGTPEAVEETHRCFQEQLDVTVEDRRDFSKTMTSIFRSPLGQLYLHDVTAAHNGCKLHVGTTFLLCAGRARNDVKGCLTEIESDVRTEPLKVSNFSNQDLERLRRQVEEEYLARLIFRDASEGEILLEGLGRDVDLARGFLLRQVDDFQKDTHIFLIKGQARSKCFKNCFASQLSEVKAIIRQNRGSIDERFENDRLMLTYQIRQGKLKEIQMRLNIIKGSIWTDTVDLKEEFPDVADQWLLLKGFKKTAVKEFQASFERIVKERCYMEIDITSKRWGNVARPQQLGTGGRRRGDSAPGQKLNPLLNLFFTGRLTAAPFHRSVIIRNTLVTVMSGDISTVTADVLVSPISAKELDMTKTAVGKALIKRFGPEVQEDLTRLTLGSHHSDVIESPLPPHHQPVCTLYHVLLQRWSAPTVEENIKTLVQTCLALAEENHCTSIAFPLLGCGRKFKLAFSVVRDAMIDGTRAALVKASTGTSLQKLTFVIHTTREAQSFAQQLEVLTPVASEQQEMTSELQESGDWLLEKLASSMPKAEEMSGTLLMAHLFGPSRDINATARARLVQELRQTFLYEDSIEHAGLLQLPQHATAEIRAAAQVDSVIITRPPTGGSCLRLKGEHQAVSKLKEVIQGKLLQCLQLPMASPSSSHPSPLLGRHSSYHLPAYWSVAANPTLLEEAVQNRYKLVEVSEGERTAIENLVRGTWQPDLVAAGTDAAGLRHRSIDVIKVQRVENPSLYENYHNRRTSLQRETSESGQPCKPVGSIPVSSGPVLSTALMTTGNPLFRELHLDVNEHYLFHGTQAQNLQAILKYGPDARLASAGGMLGSGIYFAESFTKSDRYADDRNRRTAGEKKVLLMRVLLGNPFINNAVKPTRYLRPPCRVCKDDKCRGMHGGFFDSVIDDCLTCRAFRELIVYESALCYPEYAITYLRQG